jgi:hypothetical protein
MQPIKLHSRFSVCFFRFLHPFTPTSPHTVDFGLFTQKQKRLKHHCLSHFRVVAGEGFEPTTFGL